MCCSYIAHIKGVLKYFFSFNPFSTRFSWGVRSWLFLWQSEWRTNFKNSPGGNCLNSLTIRHTDLCLVPNESSHQALSNGVLGRTYRGLVPRGLMYSFSFIIGTKYSSGILHATREFILKNGNFQWCPRPHISRPGAERVKGQFKSKYLFSEGGRRWLVTFGTEK